MPQKSTKKPPQTKKKIAAKRSTKPLKNENIQPSDYIDFKKALYPSILIAAALLPLVGWAIGASLNPEGWISDNPTSAYYLLILFVIPQYWYIPMIAVAILLVTQSYFTIEQAAKFFLKSVSILIFIVSLIYSIIVMTAVKDSGSSEFTG